MNISMYQIVLLSCGLALVGVGPGVDAQPPGEPDTNTRTEDVTAWIQSADEMLEHLFTMRKTLESSDAPLEAKANRAIFSAGNPTSATGDVGPHPSDTILIYKKVFVNVADAYNKEKGIFTAPERGVYFFAFFYHSRSRKSAHSGLSLFKNSDRIATTAAHIGEHIVASPGHVFGGDFGDNGSNSVALELEKGDTVYVGLDEEMSIWGDEDSHNTFSGFQLV